MLGRAWVVAQRRTAHSMNVNGRARTQPRDRLPPREADPSMLKRDLKSGLIRLAPMHKPVWQVSVCVQASLSVHAVPLPWSGFEHVSVCVQALLSISERPPLTDRRS